MKIEIGRCQVIQYPNFIQLEGGKFYREFKIERYCVAEALLTGARAEDGYYIGSYDPMYTTDIEELKYWIESDIDSIQY